MEQWVLDGRDAIRDRGFSRIPGYVEEDGFTIDASGGLRGLLKKAPKATSTTSNNSSSTTHADPEVKAITASSPSPSAINYAKGLPQLYAECEVDYEYRFNGRIVDTNKEQLALEELIKQLAVEEKEAQRMAALEREMEAQTAAAIAAEKGETVVLPKKEEEEAAPPISCPAAAANAAFDQHTSKIITDGTTAYPTPKNIPKADTYYPLELVLGAGQVTQAMDEALLQMHEGEETEWWIDPAFAFRDHGLRTKFGSIPADAAIQLKVKLLRFNNPMSSYERIMYSTTLKDEANQILNKALAAERIEQEYRQQQKQEQGVTPTVALPSPSYEDLMKQVVLAYNNVLNKMGKTFVYKTASAPRLSAAAIAAAGGKAGEAAAAAQPSPKPAPEPKTREEQIVMDNQLRAIIFTNLSLCWFKRDDLARSTDYIERALKCNPNYSKALFRRALIEERRCNFDEAEEWLQKILSIVAEGKATDTATVNVKDVEAKIATIKATSAKQDAAQRRTFQGMFSKGVM